jgi:MFS family permease
MTFFGSSANDACFNAWLTDSTTSENRGMAEGINAMMPLMAILVVFGGAMLLPQHEKAPSAEGIISTNTYWSIIFGVIGAIVIVIGILGFFIIKEPKVEPVKESYFGGIIYGFRPKTIKQNPRLYVSLLAFIIFNISIQIFMPYLIIYYQVSLQMTDYVLIMAPAIILAGIATAFYGRYYDKVGFFKSLIPTLLSLSLGYVLLFFFRDTIMVFLGSLFMMTGYLTGMAVFGAMIRDYTPSGKAGAFQGLRIVGQVLVPGIIGPAIGAAVLANADVIIGGDGTQSFIPNQNIFIAALVASIFAFALVFVIRAISKKANKKA